MELIELNIAKMVFLLVNIFVLNLCSRGETILSGCRAENMRFNYTQHKNIMTKEKDLANIFFKSCIIHTYRPNKINAFCRQSYGGFRSRLL